jgi:hypothetical protein
LTNNLTLLNFIIIQFEFVSTILFNAHFFTSLSNVKLLLGDNGVCSISYFISYIPKVKILFTSTISLLTNFTQAHSSKVVHSCPGCPTLGLSDFFLIERVCIIVYVLMGSSEGKSLLL